MAKLLCELSAEQYESLKKSGMMYEFFPEATGTFEEDTKIDEQYVYDELIRLQREDGDTEMTHVEADNLLCKLLDTLGYTQIVIEYNKIDKWFA